MPENNSWKTDLHKFVGRSFDFAYNNRMNKMLQIIGTDTSNSVDYELTGTGGYGRMKRYDGQNLNMANMQRGFKTIITPDEFTLTVPVGYKAAKIDKQGECRKVGTRLGTSAAMSVYMDCLDLFAAAFNPNVKGGDGVSWAHKKHPVASKGSKGRVYIPDPDAGTYSNLVNLDLTVDNICKVQELASYFVTPDGMPLAAEFNTLLVSPAYEEQAKKICGDGAKLRPTRNPDDDTNAANPLYDLHYMVVAGGHSGLQGKQWALCDPELMKELVKLIYITKPMVKQHFDGNPFIELFTAYADYEIGWGDGRMIIFSTGA